MSNATTNTELNTTISELQSMQHQVSRQIRADQNNPSSNANQLQALQSINSQTQVALSNLYSYANNTNSNMSEAIAKSLEAEVFIKEAKGLLQDIYKEDQKRLENMKIDETTQLKEIQFNNYFSQKYNYNVGIMKILVVTSVLLMICIILHTRSLIPDFIYTILLSIIISIALIIIVTMLISEARRSNTTFTNFKWYFNENNAPNNAS
jgi:hypothetical protein